MSILGYRGVLRIMGGFCVLHMDDLIPIILGETHYSKYFIHPGVTKMYRNLKQPLNGVKKKCVIVDFMAKCQNITTHPIVKILIGE